MPAGLDAHDLELKQWLETHDRRYLVIATKMDKLNQSESSEPGRIRKEAQSRWCARHTGRE